MSGKPRSKGLQEGRMQIKFAPWILDLDGSGLFWGEHLWSVVLDHRDYKCFDFIMCD